MNFFLDSADIAEIRQSAQPGLISGVTINQAGAAAALATSARPFTDLLAEICGLCCGPVSAEAVGEDHDSVMRHARELAGVARNVVVQVPVSAAGLKVISACAAEGIKAWATGCLSPAQAVQAANAGAAYLSPSVARRADRAGDGIDQLRRIIGTCRDFQCRAEIVVASVRDRGQVCEAALVGAPAATVPFALLQQLVTYPVVSDDAATCPGSVSTSTR